MTALEVVFAIATEPKSYIWIALPLLFVWLDLRSHP